MTLHFINLRNVPILAQLQLEEALLRTSEDNFCIVNTDAPKAIVMGISGKPEELISDAAFQKGIPVIKRFSGGGTVAVDEDTLFISFIFNKEKHPFPPFPEPIYRWSEQIYKEVFPSTFSLRENDYTFGDKKFGGNAQYIKRGRWLHHSTFLWNYTTQHMNLLTLPQRRPKYRIDRTHDEFLCTLKEHFSSKEEIIEKLKETLQKRYSLHSIEYEEAAQHLVHPHRKATVEIKKTC